MNPTTRELFRTEAIRRRLELARYMYDTIPADEAATYSPHFLVQRREVNEHIRGAQAALAAIARESDLFYCRSCDEHFTSHDVNPICGKCKTYKIKNVPEDTIYCHTCYRGADRIDDEGCCADCARSFAAQRIAIAK